MFTVEQLIAHVAGDYLLQSDWMATRKRESLIACLVHAVFYTLPFLFLTQRPEPLIFIAGSHLVIDYLGVARYLCFAKNYLAPPWAWPIWQRCNSTGYDHARPAWLTTWLYIIVDNLLHVCCNAGALKWL